ncbi:MAG: RNA polymerase sigma factor, partial [Candidatus Nanopelagicaceae bacterium]
SLSAQQRAVLVLVFEHGLVLREVSEILEIPLGTAASHLARGKAAVAAYIDLVPELERSLNKSLPAPGNQPHEIGGVVFGEVVE